MSASNLLNSLIALAGGSFAAAVAAFLPPPSSWDATDAAAFAFVCGVAGGLLGAGANWVLAMVLAGLVGILGPVRDPASGELVKRYDDRRWGENLAVVGGAAGLLMAAL